MISLNRLFLFYLVLFCALQNYSLMSQNPFLRPGSQKPKPVAVPRPLPPPPPPKPQNTNIELRGFFKFKDEWYFSIFDKSKNKGVWLKKGESFDDGKVEIESFNPETEVIKMKGGATLSLKKSDGKVLSVPSGMPVKKSTAKTSTKNSTNIPSRTIPSSRKIVTSGGRTITIPPRAPLPTPRK